MRTSLNALTARKHDSRPMESHASILIISLSYLGYKLCQRTPHTQRRCAIEQIMCMSPGLSGMFSMVPIISLYSTPSFPVMRTILFSTFRMDVTLLLVFRRTVLLHSRGAIRLVGPSFFSTTISLLKYVSKRNIAFTLPPSWAPKNLGIGTRFAGH